MADIAEGLDRPHAEMKKGLQQDYKYLIYYRTLILF